MFLIIYFARYAEIRKQCHVTMYMYIKHNEHLYSVIKMLLRKLTLISVILFAVAGLNIHYHMCTYSIMNPTMRCILIIYKRVILFITFYDVTYILNNNYYYN